MHIGTVRRVPDLGTFTDYARSVGVDDVTAAAAHRNLTSGKVLLLATSGKLGAGKDTVTEAVFDRLNLVNRSHWSYATALKDEVDQIIAHLRRVTTLGRVPAVTPRYRAFLGKSLEDRFSLPAGSGEVFTGRFYDQVRCSSRVHSRTRNQAVRQVLQKHGTEIRRSQDDQYWVGRTLGPTLRDLAAGVSVYFTDVRFPNEAIGAQQIGGFVARLDVTTETQLARVAARDSHAGTPTAAALTHASELALDDFAHFDVRVSNDGPLASTVAAVVSAITGVHIPAAA